MVDELGTEPSDGLRRLHQLILTADPALDITPPTRAVKQAPVPRELPGTPASFVGRHTELAQLDTELNACGTSKPVVISAIAGTGGMGKTWLALRWAHRHADRFFPTGSCSSTCTPRQRCSAA